MFHPGQLDLVSADQQSGRAQIFVPYVTGAADTLLVKAVLDENGLGTRTALILDQCSPLKETAAMLGASVVPLRDSIAAVPYVVEHSVFWKLLEGGWSFVLPLQRDGGGVVTSDRGNYVRGAMHKIA